MATVSKPVASERFVMTGVRWATYTALRADRAEAGTRVRMTFDRGTLELMAPSYEHEQGSFHLNHLIVAVASGLRIAIEGGGSTTFAREDLDRGLEPDECFYVAGEPMVRGHDAIDLTVDPPPDLTVEVDVSQSSIDKLSVYAAIGVREFWRLDDGVLEFLELGPDRQYRPVEASLCFPPLGRAEAEMWLRRRKAMPFIDWLLDLQAWARDVLAPRLVDQTGR